MKKHLYSAERFLINLVALSFLLGGLTLSPTLALGAERGERGERGSRNQSVSESITVTSVKSFPSYKEKSSLPALSAFEKFCAKLSKKKESVSGLPNMFFCDDVTPPPPPPPTPTVDINGNPTLVTIGSASTLTWNSENADSCVASDGWSGSKALDGSEIVTISATTTYTITCTGDGGSASDSVTVNAVPMPPPLSPSLSFNGNPLTVTSGATSTLSWNSENADTCVASDGWSGMKSLDGSEIVTVNATSTYVLACGNGISTSTQSVTVNVVPLAPPPSPTLTFTGNPLSITEGSTSTLSWISNNTSLCVASNGWDGMKNLSGDEIVSPSATTTYTLSCGGEGGTTTENVIINVSPIPPPAPTFGKVVISEVFYDVDDAHGVETSNEWVELYNGSSTPINVSGWSIWDSATSSSDVIPDGTIIPALSFLVLTASTTATSTESFWDIPSEVEILMIGNASLGSNGFANGGDAVYLRNGEDVMDAMSYGTNIDVFDPAAPDVAEGHSLRRNNLSTDTDTAADWEDREVPTPGSN